MKKIYFFIIALATMTMFSCINDDSTYADSSIKLEVGGLEKSYDVVSFSNDELHLTPTVTTSFPEDDLEYIWCYYDVAKANTASSYGSDTLKCDTISHDRNLTYSFNVIDGVYRLLFSARSKSTGYTQTVGTDIVSASSLSRGFCVLKEDADGNTDYDIYNPVYGTVISDVLKSYQGKAMSGKPRCIDVIYQMAYINEDNDESAGANMLSITTENNEFQVVRALDCKTMYTKDNVHYEKVENEIPYRILRGPMNTFFFSNNAVYNCYAYDIMDTDNSGVLGAYYGNGSSMHVVSGPNSWGLIYWNNQTSSFDFVDANGTVSPTSSLVAGHKVQNANLNCIACGLCTAAGEIVYFIMQDRSNSSKKYIYYFELEQITAKLTSVRELAADAPFANAERYAVNGRTATVAYYLKDNKVFTYNLVDENDVDKELVFNGLPAGEKITYVSNRYFTGGNSFDYLIIGTQTGDTYKVYMYNMIAGEPVGAPDLTFSGKGILNRITYVYPTVDAWSDESYLPILDQ